jgi:hypothetical protein
MNFSQIFQNCFYQSKGLSNVWSGFGHFLHLSKISNGPPWPFLSLGLIACVQCTAVTLDETRERTSASWIHNPCSGHVDSSQIWWPASDWTVLDLNNLWQMKLFHWLIND